MDDSNPDPLAIVALSEERRTRARVRLAHDPAVGFSPSELEIEDAPQVGQRFETLRRDELSRHGENREPCGFIARLQGVEPVPAVAAHAGSMAAGASVNPSS